MTPQEAREIDPQEAAAESARIRQMAQDIVERYQAMRPAQTKPQRKIVREPIDARQSGRKCVIESSPPMA